MANCSIFFYTNVIEAQFSYDKVNLMFHNRIVPNQLFHEVTNYIKNNGLEAKVNLFISCISWEEMSLHLKENYKVSKDKFARFIEAFNKAYGDTLDISYDFKNNSFEEYNNYLETIKNEFLTANNCKLIDFPRDVECFEQLVDKCVHKQAPFQKAKAGGKDFSDAGFKDAVIFETIVRHKRDSGSACIFVTTDGDFREVEGIHICSNIGVFQETITQILGLQNIDTVRNRFNDDYIRGTIIEETGNVYDESVSTFEVLDINPIAEEDGLFDVTIKAIINEAIYNIKCRYETYSNSVDVKDYSIKNE